MFWKKNLLVAVLVEGKVQDNIWNSIVMIFWTDDFKKKISAASPKDDTHTDDTQEEQMQQQHMY
eukprot:8037188-Ditylum_brightwellii.AAC.1